MSTATKPLDMTLDNGTFTLVEASAGTGKTWLIVALIVRLVVEYEIPIEEILLITFTRAATAEIRRRVRDRLVEVSTFLASNKTDPGDDALLARFLKLPGMSRKTAVERLERSLRDFDRAPISTIHSFCQRMLTEFACEADQDPGLTPVDKAPGVIADLVADVLTSTACVASPAAWSALRKTGWSEKGLSWIAAKMTGPSAPCVEPVSAFATCEAAVKGVGKAAADIAGAQQALADLLSSAEGTAYTEQLQQLCKTRHLDGFDGRQKPAEKARRWVESARLGPVKWGTEKSSQLLRYGTAELTNVWKPKSVDPATRIDLPTGQRIANALVVWEATFACVSNACSVALATFARDVRSDYEVQLARSGLLTYDSMLGDLAKVFDAADHAAANRLAEAIRRRYRVALVDEFQDTDHTQWTTLRAAFLSTETRLVVVGDPKQSIYAFRGAELDVYRAAVRTVQPQRTHTLDRNFRSDRVLVDALNALWQPVASVQPVMGKEALYHRIESKLPARIAWGASARDRRPLELRPFDDRLVGGKGDGWPDKTSAAQCLAEQCADECSTLLTRDIATIEGRALRPSDLAVLVRTNDQAATVKRALDRRGIASTLGGSRLTIDKTPPADWILAWLEALDDPTREAPARRLALTPLVGATLDEIAPSQGDDDASATLAGLRDYLHKQSESWFQAGMATLLGRLMRQYASWPRILGLLAGARDATDLRHLMRVLDDAQRRGRLDPGALAASLRARRSGIEVSSDQSQVDDGNLELDGAGDAVRIVTIHAAKGLQYPVVLLPFAWDEWKVSEPSLPRLLYTPPTPLGAMPRRHLLLGPKNTANWQNALDLARVAGREESARMLYVAMTRAKHHVVAWVGCAAGAGSGVLTEIVDRGARGTGDLTPLALTTSLDALQSAHATLIRAAVAPALHLAPGQLEPALRLPFRPWTRTTGDLTGGWHLASYTALSKGRQTRPGVPSDEATLNALVHGSTVLNDLAPGHVMQGGGEVLGTFVHGVLEVIDFSVQIPPVAPGASAKRGEPEDPVTALLHDTGSQLGVTDPATLDAVQTLLPAWLDTPLHLDKGHPTHRWSLREGFALSELRREHRRDELRFDLSIGGATRGRVADTQETLRLIASLSSKKPLEGLSAAAAAWAEALHAGQCGAETMAAPEGQTKDPVALVPAIRGMLNGSIDLLFRAKGRDGIERYYVCDYKTNNIQGPQEVRDWVSARYADATTPAGGNPRIRNLHFSAPFLAWEMGHHAYHLQSLLYTLAVHRLLASRLPGYAHGGEAMYDQHVGGHLYLFLRGMGGEHTPRDQGAALGVWADRWPYEVVHRLDEAMHGIATGSAPASVELAS